MKINQYGIAVSETVNYTDKDAYVSDLALSSIWSNAEDADREARLEDLGKIWDATHRTVKQIAKDAGVSQRKLAERFCIPYRTMENWCSGGRECNLYIRLIMQECLGLLDVDISK